MVSILCRAYVECFGLSLMIKKIILVEWELTVTNDSLNRFQQLQKNENTGKLSIV
jgi:hypothetical protein